MFKCDSMDICSNKIIKAKAASTQHITVLLSVADIPKPLFSLAASSLRKV